MRRKLQRFGLVRSIGALLTLVGVAVVFVVLILPTTASGSAKGGGVCKLRFKSFSTDKVDRQDDPPSGEEDASVVAIFGSNLNRVDEVQFGGPKNDQWITASSFTYVQPGGYIQTQPSEDSLGVPGRIRIVDFDVSPTCYATSKSQFTPTHAS